jgi:hypothetical protein
LFQSWLQGTKSYWKPFRRELSGIADIPWACVTLSLNCPKFFEAKGVEWLVESGNAQSVAYAA